MIRKIFSFIYSTKLMAVLFIGYAIAMAAGTFIENSYDMEAARIWVYNTWWFEVITLLFVINFIGNIKRFQLLKRKNWAGLVLHLAWIFIIIGAGITRYISDEGTLSLREGETTDSYLSDRTYITAMVDGIFEGQPLRKKQQKEVLFSVHTQNHYRWTSDFKGKPFEIKYISFSAKAQGMNALTLEISSGGERQQVTVMGRKGMVHPPVTIKLNQLDFHLSYGSIYVAMPFSIKLDDFIAEKYPGTENSYSSFKSKVTISSKDETFDEDIYMNHILNYKGYRLFQSSFHPDEKGTILSVNHDFWGTLVTYMGYILLFGGLLAFMWVGKSRFKRLNQQLYTLQQKRSLAVLLLLLCGTVATAQNELPVPDKAHAAKFGA